MNGEWLPTVLITILLASAVIAWIFSVAWVYDDANRRNMAGWAVALLVAFVSWPLSLIVWLVIRPRNRRH